MFFVVYQIVSRRKFQQIEVLEAVNAMVSISGKRNKLRVYLLSYLKSKILKLEEVNTLYCAFSLMSL